MYTLMKKIIKYLVDADEFSYIHKKNEHWEVYDSYSDKIKKLVQSKY